MMSTILEKGKEDQPPLAVLRLLHILIVAKLSDERALVAKTFQKFVPYFARLVHLLFWRSIDDSTTSRG